MQKKTIYITIGVLAIAAAIYYFYNKKKVNADAMAPQPMGSISTTTAQAQSTTTAQAQSTMPAATTVATPAPSVSGLTLSSLVNRHGGGSQSAMTSTAPRTYGLA